MAGNTVAKPAEETVDQGVKEYRLAAPRIRATFIPFGARLTSLQVPDRDGNWKEVVVGHKDVAEYKKETAPTYYGCVVG
jgi:aldose 1-epimerase